MGNFRGMPVDQHATAPLFFFVICKYPPSLAYALFTLVRALPVCAAPFPCAVLWRRCSLFVSQTVMHSLFS